jgi:hypothetical protein
MSILLFFNETNEKHISIETLANATSLKSTELDRNVKVSNY